MSMTPSDAAYEEFMEELHKEWEEEYADQYREEGEENFINRRLSSYFIQYPDMDARAKRRCEQSRALLDVSYDACMVLAYSAAEVGFKTLLLKPIIYGFVNSDPVAELVSTAIVSNNREEKRFRNLIDVLFLNITSVDLRAITLCGQTDALWRHIEISREKRNAILHRIEYVERPVAEHAVALASSIVERLFPLLRYKMQSLAA